MTDASEQFAQASSVGVADTPAGFASALRRDFGREQPFPARVLVNRVLTEAGSSKERRHLELELAGSGLDYQPGDALGVVPCNAAPLVTDLLEALGVPETAPTEVAGRTLPFAEALAAKYEITIPTPRFLRHWAALSASAELAALTVRDNTEARRRFLRGNHIVDIVRRYPVRGLRPGLVTAGLNPLAPRRYSIASSPAWGGNVAITVATTCYRLNGALRRGVFSGHQAPALEPGAHVPVFIEANPDFRLPSDDVPLLMIGAGTGVAPFRAFIAERRARGARGRSWLFFGDRKARTDFLYREEWARALRDGYLTRLDTAFSREGAEKVYVQHRLLARAAALRSWLEDGAAIYVCGNAGQMAPAVHAAIVEIVMGQGGIDRNEAVARIGALARQRRYCRDVY